MLRMTLWSEKQFSYRARLPAGCPPRAGSQDAFWVENREPPKSRTVLACTHLL